MDRDIHSLSGALALLDEWIEAYHELERDHARLLQRYDSAKTFLQHARAAIANDLHPPTVEERQAIESEIPF